MKHLNIHVKIKREFKHTTDSEHNKAVYPNLVHQEFKVSQMNEIWVSDITYIRTQKGWLYLAIEAFYNQKRRHSTIGYVSPMNFDEKNVFYKNAA